MTRARTARRITLRQATLTLLLCATGTVTAAPAAYAVPTCHGRPATIVGTSGDDDLRGTAGDDVIVGGGGVDQIYGGRGDDVLCSGPSQGALENRTDPTLSGGPGNDILIGGSGYDGLGGGTGDDLLIGRGGSDSLDGGAGDDVLHGGPGADDLDGWLGADRIFGQAGADRISDYDGANRLHGGDGRDWFASGRGDEIIDGGRGRDVASYVYVLHHADGSRHCHPITADLAAETASGVGFGTDTLNSIEGVWSGGGSDVLVGDSAANTFYTGSLDNESPQCDDPAPSESVSGGGGADRIRFDTNEFEDQLSTGPVRVDLALQTARWRNEGGRPAIALTLDSIENVTGTEQRDVIMGDDGPNRLSGGGWYVGDVMQGRGGADHLYGHGGRDRFYGGAGPDVLYGGRNADRLRGGLGADRLFGSNGNDRLGGGSGRNRNAGGAGTDTCMHPGRGPRALSCER